MSESLNQNLSRSHGRAKTQHADDTSNAAIDNDPNVSGQIIKTIIVPIRIAAPDQKITSRMVVIDTLFQIVKLILHLVSKSKLSHLSRIYNKSSLSLLMFATLHSIR